MNEYSSIRVGVVGATGYSGVELIRRLARHPRAQVVQAMGSAGAQPRYLPALKHIWDEPVIGLDLERLGSSDAVFLAVPDTLSAEVAPELVTRGVRVFDLSGAFRLRDKALRSQWYPHSPDLDQAVVYGLTERHRAELRDARFVACAGCYPTAAILSLQPLVAAGLLEPGIVIDAKSGVSGAGRTPTERTHFSEVHGSMAAYGVFAHRHAVEIEQEVGAAVTFVPHLVPLDRGILETIYVRLRPGVQAADIEQTYAAAYADAAFVRRTGADLPEIKHVAHTNFCDIGWRVSPDGRQLVIVSCIDNLVKGAAGQAIQNFNVAFGLPEAAGLH
jgi:N-acetyl-gamma-glutamyl-phosphate reductase